MSAKRNDKFIIRELNYYIDPLYGSDSIFNDGKTSTSALRTFKRLSEIWNKEGNVLSSPIGWSKIITVHILNNLSSTDPLNFDVILDNVDLRFMGYIPPPSNNPPSGQQNKSNRRISVQNIVIKNRDTNIPWQFTIEEEIDIGNRIYYKDRYMWTVKKVEDTPSGRKYRISEPIGIPEIGFLENASRKTPEVGDDFYVHTLLNIKPGSMRVCSTGNSGNSLNRNRLVFQNLNIAGDISPELDMNSELFCYGCSITGSILLATGFARNFINCFHFPGQMIRITSGLTRFMAGAYISTAHSSDGQLLPNGSQGFLPTNCTTQFDFDVIFQDHSISIVAGNTLILGTVGIFDSVPGGNGRTNNEGNGLVVSGGSVTCRPLQDKDDSGNRIQHLWGSGQKGYGVSVSSGSRFYYVSNPPTIDGKGGPLVDPNNNFILESSSSCYGPDVDGKFIGPTSNSWKNLIKTLSVGIGFGGNASNPQYDAWILKTQ